MDIDKKSKLQIKNYLRWPLMNIVVLIALTVIIYGVDRTAGMVMIITTLIIIALILLIYARFHKLVDKALIAYAKNFIDDQVALRAELDIPYALINQDHDIVWSNKGFNKIFADGGILKELFGDTSWEDTDVDMEYHQLYNKRNYKIVFSPAGSADEQLMAVFIYDETELVEVRENISNNSLVAGLIYIDNYEEVMESVEAVRQSLLTALIDRKINQHILSHDGIVKKLEKDKYFFVIKQIGLLQMKENRFEVIEDVKTVNIGNEMSVTLSIGIGMGGESYSQNYDYARMAIDMALGRGGDQAVLKNADGISYYGGKSQTMEKTTRVKARVKAKALKELLEGCDRLIIMGHKMMDIDCFGSAIGLYRIAMSMGKKAHIVKTEVNPSLLPTLERFKESEYPDDFFIDGDKARELMDDNTMLMVVDTNRPSITEAPVLLKIAKKIVVLDHHRQSSECIENTTLSYVETSASSACEMVAEILQYIADNIRLRPQEVDAVYAGIVIDSQNFHHQTGARTFEAAAFLRRNGADITRVRKLFREKLEDHVARAQGVHNAEVYMDSFALSICRAEQAHSPTLVCAQVANELLNIEGIKASIVLTKYNKKIYVSARSMDEINVQIIMEHLGGGGHRAMAGVQLEGIGPEEAMKKIKVLIKEMIERGEI